MNHVRYFVMPHAGHWLVTLEGRTMAHVASKAEAINSATVMADLMGSMGHDADVMLDDGETLAIIWTYGQNRVSGVHQRKVPKPPRRPGRSHVKPAGVPA